MERPIEIPVRLDAATFRRYCAFDAHVRQRRWYWPTLLAMLLITAALAGLLGWISMSPTLSGLLMGLGLAVVMLNVGLYLLSVEAQVAQQRLKERPLIYTLTLDDRGLRVVNGQKKEAPIELSWDSLWAAYAYKGDIYLYVNSERALILPHGQASVTSDILWAFLEAHLNKGKCMKV